MDRLAALVRFDNAYLVQGRADLRLLDDVIDVISDPFWRDQVLSRRFLAMSRSSGRRATLEAASTLLQRPPSGPPTTAHPSLQCRTNRTRTHRK